MKRFTRFLFIAVVLMAVSNTKVLFAQSYYKVHHINESFTGLGGTTLPTNWATVASTAALYARSGGVNTDNTNLKVTGSGSGNRGIDVSFPSPAIADSVSNVWFVEFDWKCDKVVMGPKNAFGLVFSGSTNNKNLRAANWYVASIFGLYLTGDGYFHYWNQDLAGPYQSDSASRVSNPQYYKHMGPVFRGGSSDGQFARNGVAATFAKATVNTTLSNDSVDNWNASTKTNVKFRTDSISKLLVTTYGPRYLASRTYHITAKLNFNTQRVEALTITQNDSTANSQTINDMPFMAPTMIGNDTTVVARADRLVKDLKYISQFNTRTSTAGSGPNVDYVTYTDNLEIYYLKQSVGTSDVTVVYKDQDGNIAKTARVAAAQQNNELFKLTDADKAAFTANGNYYAYNATATHDANPSSTDGESIIISPTLNTLTVVLKRFPTADGSLVWNGFEGPFWNQTDGNFRVGATTGFGYQSGKAVELSDATAPKDIIIDGTIDMGTADLTISTSGYTLSGNGKTTDKLTGKGKIQVNAPATLAMTNTMKVMVNTTEGVLIKSATVADTIQVVNNGLVQLQPDASFSKKILGAGKGSAINIESLASTSGIDYNYAILNASTINMKLKNAGKLVGSSWTSRMSTSYSDSTLINVTNEISGKDTLAGFSGITGNLAKVKVHLGDSVRLVRNYNEAANETVTIGEISGTAKSIIEAGFVAGRTQTYAVGNLNTDAVFDGAIRPFLMSNKTFRTGNTLHLNKIGTGKWTIGGKLSYSGDIEVKAGTLELLGTVTDSVKSIVVDSLATLKTGAIAVASKNVTVKNAGSLISENTNFAGDLQVSGTLSGAATMYNFGAINGTINLNVTSFDAGDYQKIASASDITLIKPKINLSVQRAKAGQTIQLFVAGSGMITYPEGTAGLLVTVNGEDITANTETTAGAKYIFFAETGELKSLVDYTDVRNINADKEVKSVRFYSVLGYEVDKYSKGLLIRKTTYIDNSTTVEKIYLKK
ncbi:MAG: hypothetical protein QM800_02615 [Paludibacter sp.]